MIKLSLKLDVSSSNLVLGIVGLSAVASAVYYFSSVGKVNPLSKFLNKALMQKKSKIRASNVHEANAKYGNDETVSSGSESNKELHRKIKLNKNQEEKHLLIITVTEKVEQFNKLNP